MIIFDRSEDIKKNPGPKSNSYQRFSFWHWNLSSIFAHDFLKRYFLRTYIAVHNFDITCLSDTYLDLSILHDGDNLQIPDINLYREDHPLNIK